jgi:hypothetical protein
MSDKEPLATGETVAPRGTLKWFPWETTDNHDEVIPLADKLAFDVACDEGGHIYPAVALRDSSGTAIGAVQLTHANALELGRWCFEIAICRAQIRRAGANGAAARAMMLEQISEVLDDIAELAPDVLTKRAKLDT